MHLIICTLFHPVRIINSGPTVTSPLSEPSLNVSGLYFLNQQGERAGQPVHEISESTLLSPGVPPASNVACTPREVFIRSRIAPVWFLSPASLQISFVCWWSHNAWMSAQTMLFMWSFLNERAAFGADTTTEGPLLLVSNNRGRRMDWEQH